MIYLCRHGQTEFNREKRLQGHRESNLTDLGRQQARRMGERLLGVIETPKAWRIISSPLGRARDSAEIIRSVLGVETVEIDDRLIEITCGDWDGRLRSEIEAEVPDAFGPNGWDFKAPGGETYEAMIVRLSSWLASLPNEPERRIIAVSHGIAGRVLRGIYAQMPQALSLALPVPQDAIFELRNATLRRLDCEPI